MSRIYCSIALITGFLLAGCASKPSTPAGDRPRVTVLMRDGTQLTGSLVENSATGITVEGDDHVTKTIPMAQVKLVDYGTAPPSTAPVDSAAAPTQPPPSQSASTPATPPAAPPPPPAPDPVHDNHQHPTESAITTRTYVLPVGTRISVRNEEAIDSGKAVEGQTFAAEVTSSVRDADNNVVIPRGSNARIVILSASKGGKFRGTSDLVLDLQSVSVDGRQYHLSTVDLAQRGKEGMGANTRTAEHVGGGAALGAIIGAIAGGGKGAAIGAASGAGAGTAVQVLTKGAAVRVPVESVLTFQLDRPLHVVSEQ